MTRMITMLAAGALVIAAPLVMAQTSDKTEAQASATAQANGTTSGGEQTGSLAAGTAVNAELNQALDSKKAKEGDSVTAHTTDAVKSDGKVVIPKGSKLVGHVTRSTARAKGDADSALAVQFDRAILKNGQEMPLQVTIQALASGEPGAAVGGDDLQGAGMGGGTATSGGGAGRGAIGGVGSTVGGAASGAASTVPRTTQNATGAVNSTVSGAASSAGAGAGSGLSAGGQLTATSRGVFGLQGLSLNANAANATEGSVITSTGKNVRLDSGTRMLLVAQAGTSASAQR